MGMAPRLAELQEGLENAPRDGQGGNFGVSMQGQELDWMMLLGPFQLRIFHYMEKYGLYEVKQVIIQLKKLQILLFFFPDSKPPEEGLCYDTGQLKKLFNKTRTVPVIYSSTPAALLDFLVSPGVPRECSTLVWFKDFHICLAHDLQNAGLKDTLSRTTGIPLKM